jgi:pimeloyl-ACP methyl ester carboxylesterase
VAPRLSVDRRVLDPDLPGFGDSPAVGAGFDLEAVAGAVADDLSERVSEPFDLLGNSLGGAVAVVLCDLRPELVRSLILAAPAGFSTRSWPIAFAAVRLAEPVVHLRRRLGLPLVVSPTARRLLLWGAIAEPARLPTRHAATMLGASRGARRLGPAVSAVLQEDLGDRLAEAEVPIGVIWGKRDRVVPIATLERIRAVVPEVRVETIEDAAHVPQLERPTAFVTAVRRLLARLG